MKLAFKDFNSDDNLYKRVFIYLHLLGRLENHTITVNEDYTKFEFVGFNQTIKVGNLEQVMLQGIQTSSEFAKVDDGTHSFYCYYLPNHSKESYITWLSKIEDTMYLEDVAIRKAKKIGLI